MSNETTNTTVKREALKPLLFYQAVSLGCDPEFFFAKGGKVIGSEKVLDAGGIETKPQDQVANYHPKGENISKFIMDGVQAELNPRPSSCRALLGNEIRACFRDLHALLVVKGVVEIGRAHV